MWTFKFKKLLHPRYKLLRTRKDITFWDVNGMYINDDPDSKICKNTIIQLINETDNHTSTKRIFNVLDLKTLNSYNLYLDINASLFDIEVLYFDVIE